MRLSDIRCRRRTDTGDLVYVKNPHSPLGEAEWASDCQGPGPGPGRGFAKNGFSISVTRTAEFLEICCAALPLQKTTGTVHLIAAESRSHVTTKCQYNSKIK